MTTLKDNADAAFRLLGLVLTRPRFDSEAVERMRVAILASLKQEDEQPSTVASKSWFATYFGNASLRALRFGHAVGRAGDHHRRHQDVSPPTTSYATA